WASTLPVRQPRGPSELKASPYAAFVILSRIRVSLCTLDREASRKWLAHTKFSCSFRRCISRHEHLAHAQSLLVSFGLRRSCEISRARNRLPLVDPVPGSLDPPVCFFARHAREDVSGCQSEKEAFAENRIQDCYPAGIQAAPSVLTPRIPSQTVRDCTRLP